MLLYLNLISPFALAEPTTPEAELAPAAETAPQPEKQLEKLAELEKKLTAALKNADQAGEEKTKLEFILNNARILMDERKTAKERKAALTALGGTGDKAVLSFLRAAARHGEPEIKIGALDATTPFAADPEGLSIGEMVLQNPGNNLKVHQAGIQLLVASKTDTAAAALKSVS